MFLKCKILLKRAYAPYTYKKSSAVLTAKDGKEFYGVAVENAEVGVSVPAEVNVINSAVAHGYTNGDFDKLYLLSNQEEYCYPSFLGIQSIVEFLSDENEIVCFNGVGDYKTLRVEDLSIQKKVRLSFENNKRQNREINEEENIDLETYKRKYREMFGDSEL